MQTLPHIILPGLVVLVANLQLWHQTIEANWQQLGSDWIGAYWQSSVPCRFECILASLLFGIPAQAGASLAMKN
jgi:hypothetical protein